MQRVASMSVVVRANGVSEAFYNGQRDRVVEAVRAEAEDRVREAKAELAKEREWADLQERNCNRMRRHEMERINAEKNRKPGLIRRLGNAAAVGWACSWMGATMACAVLVKAVKIMWVCIWVILYGLKLVAYDGEGYNENHSR